MLNDSMVALVVCTAHCRSNVQNMTRNKNTLHANLKEHQERRGLKIAESFQHRSENLVTPLAFKGTGSHSTK